MEKKEGGTSGDKKEIRMRKRIKYSDEMRLILEYSFQKSMFPSREERERLAGVCGITYDQVTVWFQNRRSGRNAAGSMPGQPSLVDPDPSPAGTAIHPPPKAPLQSRESDSATDDDLPSSAPRKKGKTTPAPTPPSSPDLPKAQQAGISTAHLPKLLPRPPPLLGVHLFPTPPNTAVAPGVAFPVQSSLGPFRGQAGSQDPPAAPPQWGAYPPLSPGLPQALNSTPHQLLVNNPSQPAQQHMPSSAATRLPSDNGGVQMHTPPPLTSPLTPPVSPYTFARPEVPPLPYLNGSQQLTNAAAIPPVPISINFPPHLGDPSSNSTPYARQSPRQFSDAVGGFLRGAANSKPAVPPLGSPLGAPLVSITVPTDSLPTATIPPEGVFSAKEEVAPPSSVPPGEAGSGGEAGRKAGSKGEEATGKLRMRLTDAQKAALEKAFADAAFPSREAREALTAETGMSFEQVKKWLERRRKKSPIQYEAPQPLERDKKKRWLLPKSPTHSPHPQGRATPPPPDPPPLPLEAVPGGAAGVEQGGIYAGGMHGGYTAVGVPATQPMPLQAPTLRQAHEAFMELAAQVMRTEEAAQRA